MTAMIDGDYAMDIIRYAILSYALYHCTIFLDHRWMDGWMDGWMEDRFLLVGWVMGMGWLGNV
jgi:hypothetical protein